MKGWLDHRAALRATGIMGGLQWLDGSFLEDKEPSDLDLVIFVTPPPGATDMAGWRRFLATQSRPLDRPTLKAQFKLDVLFLDLRRQLRSPDFSHTLLSSTVLPPATKLSLEGHVATCP